MLLVLSDSHQGRVSLHDPHLMMSKRSIDGVHRIRNRLVLDNLPACVLAWGYFQGSVTVSRGRSVVQSGPLL